MTAEKILMVRNMDGTQEAICPECKSKMEWRPGGTHQYIQAGNLVEDDYEGCWTCSCGYYSYDVVQ